MAQMVAPTSSHDGCRRAVFVSHPHQIRLIMSYVTYLVAILIYAAFAWTGKAPVEGFIAILGAAIAAYGTHQAHLISSKSATDAANLANPVPPPKAVALPTTVTVAQKQAGFAEPILLLALAITAVCVMMLSGCASQLQAVSAFNQSATVSVRAAADIAISDAKLALCATSIDTYSRHPELTEAITSLCLTPNSATSTTPTQAQTLKNYQQAAATAAPAASIVLPGLLVPALTGEQAK
jgi:hypothetical protein